MKLVFPSKIYIFGCLTVLISWSRLCTCDDPCKCAEDGSNLCPCMVHLSVLLESSCSQSARCYYNMAYYRKEMYNTEISGRIWDKLKEFMNRVPFPQLLLNGIPSCETALKDCRKDFTEYLTSECHKHSKKVQEALQSLQNNRLVRVSSCPIPFRTLDTTPRFLLSLVNSSSQWNENKWITDTKHMLRPVVQVLANYRAETYFGKDKNKPDQHPDREVYCQSDEYDLICIGKYCCNNHTHPTRFPLNFAVEN